MSKSIGFIGGGAMATGIIKGILSANTLTAEEIYVKELLPERQVYLKETYGLQLADSLKELAEKAKVLVLAVRPRMQRKQQESFPKSSHRITCWYPSVQESRSRNCQAGLVRKSPMQELCRIP